MTDTHLRHRWLGRDIRPYALAVSLATAVIAYGAWANIAVGEMLDGLPGDLIGAAAVVTVAMLWGGWWLRSTAWMTRGLLWSTGVWTAVGVVITVEGASVLSALISWCWVVASGGAWLLERGDHQGGRRGR